MEKDDAIQNNTNDFLTIPAFLGIMNRHGKVLSREFVYRAAKAGTIPTYRLNKKIFVRFDEVLAALKQGA